MITQDYTIDEISPLLDRLQLHLSDMTEVMELLGEMMIEHTKERFKTGAGPDGTGWAPTSQTTLDAYKARGDRADPRPLFGPTGRLSSEVSYTVGLDRTSVEWGSNMIYAGVMHFGAAKGAFGQTSRGSSIPWGDIPARPWLGVSEENMSNVAARLELWLRDVAGEGGTAQD